MGTTHSFPQSSQTSADNMASFAKALRPLARAATASSRPLRPAFSRTAPQIRCLSATAPRREIDISEIPPTPITHLSDTESMMAETVNKFAQEVILPKARDMDEAESMDP